MARSLSSLNRRSVVKPPIMIIYGTNGIGKTTMAAGEYIKIKYDVSESAYKAWPEVIRKEFEPARTVKPGATTVTIVKKEAA